MKKNLLIAAIAITALASCSSDEFTGGQTVRETNEEAAISFNLKMPAVTRGEQTGSTAATTLGNQFIVWGEKNEATTGTMGQAASNANTVFKNYLVNYSASTAYKTTSNTKDWEYVGLVYDDNTYSKTYSSNVSPLVASPTSPQTIKYWDYSASNYVFTAVSAKGTDITNGNVKITKNTSGTGSSNYNKGYTVTLKAGADPTKLYFSDRLVIDNTNAGTNREAVNAYGGNVTLKFRNATSQIRVGIYETIPGHTVKIDKFYYVNNATPTFDNMTTAKTDAFCANVPNITTNKAVTLTVTYKSDASVKNQPSIAVTGDGAINNFITLGGNINSATSLGTSATAPTWDTSGGNYTVLFSQEANNKNLKLKVDYTLTAEDTGEETKVKGATAEIPYQYLQWKPNYKYTYLFKINDNTNGSTGGGVVGLYPITFDAVTVVAEDGTAEYITTVSEPSITTFGVKGGKYVGGKNEYETGTDIYITIVKDNAVVNPAFMSDTHLYKVTCTDESYITEASVAEAYDHKSGNKITLGGCICTPWSNAGKAKRVTEVPAEDGSTITVTGALRFSPASGDEGIYAVQYSYGSTEYTYTALTADETSSWTSETSVEGYYVYDPANSKYEKASGTYVSGTTYYDRTVSGSGTKRVYKIIKVVAP